METTAIATRNNVGINMFDPEQFATLQRVASMFANSELVPDIYKIGPDNPKEKALANCVIAIDISSRIGASVLMIMQNLTIIYGRPSWSSKFLIATVNTCGRFESLQFKFTDLGELKDYKFSEYETEWINGPNGKRKSVKVVEKTIAGPIRNLQCVAFTSPKGGSEILESSPVSIEMAINEGWYTKKGSKWVSIPRQMLMYRAASFWTSTYAPELSMGMRTEEEIHDIEDIPYVEVTDVKATQANKNEMGFGPTTTPEAPKEPVPSVPAQEAPKEPEQPKEPENKPIQPVQQKINPGF